MDSDPRFAEYQHFQDTQHEQEIPQLRASAARIFEILFEHVRPASMLDVGCGFAPWLAVAREMGVSDICGIDGPWIDRARLLIEPERVDSPAPLRLRRRAMGKCRSSGFERRKRRA